MNSNTFLVVGLGNPGPDYSHNRHNVGQMVLDVLASRLGERFKSHKTSAHLAEGKLGSTKLILAKSNGYMNTSGAPTSALMKFYDLKPEQLIVIHDELDIDFEQLKIKFSGGHAGHNGLRSIISAIGNDFIRIRFGIGRPPGNQDPADFVLQNFSSAEKAELPVLLELAADMVETIANQGLDFAQAQYHSK
ncbi:MAG: aminoacyl-tRNA hydrolase [Rhodoluna sp.]